MPQSAFCCQLYSILVAMEPWTEARRAFVVKAFYKNGDSFVIAQREFRREFGIHRNRALPSAHAIKTWVRNFETTGSTLNKKGGSVKTVRTSENIAVERPLKEDHTVLRVATLCHSGCLKPAPAPHTVQEFGTSNSARSQTNSCGEASNSNG
jgi:transposase